jgi:HD-like signal output (HDOD) protein
MDLVNSHKDQRKRLTAIEEESSERRRSAVAAILDQSTQTHHSRNETKRIISSTSQENLANILSKLCDRDDNTQKFIAGELLKCKTTTVMASASASTSTSKRNLPRISKTVEEICRVCGETYDASEEDLTECFYHPGMSSPFRLHSV